MLRYDDNSDILELGLPALKQECFNRETLISKINNIMNTNSVWTTWIGLAVTLLGMLHFSWFISATQLTTLVNAVISFVGVVVAVIGQYKTHQTVNTLTAIYKATSTVTSSHV